MIFQIASVRSRFLFFWQDAWWQQSLKSEMTIQFAHSDSASAFGKHRCRNVMLAWNVNVSQRIRVSRSYLELDTQWNCRLVVISDVTMVLGSGLASHASVFVCQFKDRLPRVWRQWFPYTNFDVKALISSFSDMARYCVFWASIDA